MAQAVRRRPVTAEAQVRSRVGPCGICGGQSDTGTGFSPSTSVFPCQFYSTGATLKWKSRTKLIIFITGLHNKPSGCGASVASAAGPFNKRNSLIILGDHLPVIYATAMRASSLNIIHCLDIYYATLETDSCSRVPVQGKDPFLIKRPHS